MAKNKHHWTIENKPEIPAVHEQWGEHMRKVDKLIYDIDTAIELARWSNGPYSSDDGHWIEETLYKTAKGNYFIYGIGAWLTLYAATDETGASCNVGELRPLTRYEAAEWAVYHELDQLLDTEFPEELKYA